MNEVKNEYRCYQEEKHVIEKEVNVQHNNLIRLRIELREKKKKIDMVKNNKKEKDYKNITEEDIKKLESEIKNLKNSKEKILKENETKLKHLEKNKKNCEEENEKLEKLIKEKDKEMRLNSLKLKELRKLQRHNILKPMGGSKKGEKENFREVVNEVVVEGKGERVSKVSKKPFVIK